MTVSTLACWHNLSTVRGLTEPRARLQTLHVIFCTPLSGFRSSSASLVSAGFSTATMDQLFCKGEAWGAAGPKWKPFALSCSHKKNPKKPLFLFLTLSIHLTPLWDLSQGYPLSAGVCLCVKLKESVVLIEAAGWTCQWPWVLVNSTGACR